MPSSKAKVVPLNKKSALKSLGEGPTDRSLLQHGHEASMHETGNLKATYLKT